MSASTPTEASILGGRASSAILDRLVDARFAPQVFFEAGLPQALPWSLDTVNGVMRRCVGAIVLGFPRWRATPEDGAPIKLVGEYSHIEGAIALAHRLPTLIAAEVGVEARGIVYKGGGQVIVPIPADATPESLFAEERGEGQRTREFGRSFARWLEELRAGPTSSSATAAGAGTAAQIQLLVEGAGATVHNWAMDFRGCLHPRGA